MKNLIIIAAGGMGRTMYDLVRESVGYSEEFVIKGFIDDNTNALDGFVGYPPIVGTISEYQPQEDDVFVCSIGGSARKKCMESILDRGGVFQTIIHKTARIGTNVRIGTGNVIAAYTSIGSEASVGNHNLIQSYTVIGHDVKIGDWNRIDTHVTCVGGTEIKNCADVYTSAVLNHGVVVEDNAHVGALSFVIRRVKEGTTVMGNPAKKLM